MQDDETVLVLVRIGPAGDGGAPAELAAASLWAEGATAVEVREDSEGTTLLAGYPTPAAARAVAERLRGPLGARVEVVSDESWRDAWRQWVHPVPVGEQLLVVPAWRPVPIGSGRLQVAIDPGSCFGSGTHASTRLILAWLDAHPPAGSEVVDVGCGSGILGIAAARLGARTVTAVDIDPAAVTVTAANAARNGLAAVVRASTTPAAALPEAGADLVLVNVTAGTHALIGPDCARAVRPGGSLLVAGLLPGQWQHVSSAYAGLAVESELALDGWEGAALIRPPAGSAGGMLAPWTYPSTRT